MHTALGSISNAIFKNVKGGNVRGDRSAGKGLAMRV